MASGYDGYSLSRCASGKCVPSGPSLMSDILRRISVAFLLEALKATYGSRSVVDQSSSDGVSRRKGGGMEGGRQGGRALLFASWPPSSAIEKSARLNVLLLGPLDIF